MSDRKISMRPETYGAVASSRPVDLHSEMQAATAAVRQVHLDHIRALGVSKVTIANLGRMQAPFGVMTASLEGSSFQPGDGPACIVQPVIIGGELVDLVAWRSLQPDRWYLRGSSGWALGLDDPGPYPVRLHATPLDWLRADARGICVLDWHSPSLVDLALNLDCIEVPNKQLGNILLQQITRAIPLPELLVAEVRAHG